MVTKALLTETIPLVMSLEESAEGGKITFRGRVGVVGAPTLNKRRYSEAIVGRELFKLGESIKNRRLLGELDHPDDGRTRLTRVSHLISDWRIEGTDLVATFEPLPTPNGKILEALGRAGVQVGASIRGWGSTRWNKNDGVEDVGEDYEMKTFDVVYEPAAAGAYPQMVAEAIEQARMLEESMDLETLKSDHPDLYEEVVNLVKSDAKNEALMESISETEAKIRAAEEQVEGRLRAQFSVGIRQLATSLAEEAKTHARSEALSDPELAAARPVVEQIARLVAPWTPDMMEAVEAKDREINAIRSKMAESELARATVEGSLEEMTVLAKQAAYQVLIERALRERSAGFRDAVVNLVGDVALFESREALEERIRLVVGQLAEAKGEATPFKCNECGKKFKKKIGPKTFEVECPKCKSTDVLPTDYFGEADEDEPKEKPVEAPPVDDAEVEKLKEELDRVTVDRDNLRSISEEALALADRAAVEGYVLGVASRHPKGDVLVSMCESAGSIKQVQDIVRRLDEQKDRPMASGDLSEKIRRRFSKGVERDITEDMEGPAQKPRKVLPPIPGFDLEEYNRNVAGPGRS